MTLSDIYGLGNKELVTFDHSNDPHVQILTLWTAFANLALLEKKTKGASLVFNSEQKDHKSDLHPQCVRAKATKSGLCFAWN